MSQLSGNKRRLSKGKLTSKRPFKKLKTQRATNDEQRQKAKHPFQKPKASTTPLINPNDGSSKDGGDQGTHGPLSKKDARERKRDRKSKRTHGQLRIELNFMSTAVQHQVKLSKASKKEQQAFVDKLLSKIKGNILSIVSKLDSTRNIQTAIKYGSQSQIMSVAEELKGHFAELCQDRYAHRTVRALLEYGRKAVRALVIPELMPALNKLVLHRLGSSVVDYAIMVVADESTKRNAFRCFIAPKLNLLSTAAAAGDDDDDDDGKKEQTETTVQQILGEGANAQRDDILRNMHKFLLSGFEKDIMSTGIFQTVLSHYVHHMWHRPKQMAEIVEMMIEHIMQVQNVPEGVMALVDAINYSMHLKPKLRKSMLKNLAPFIINMCCDKHSYLVVMRMLDIYDDTVLLHKIIVQRLCEHLHLLLYHDFGRLVLLHLLCPRNAKYFAKNKLYQALMVAPITVHDQQKQPPPPPKDDESRSRFVDPVQQANCKKDFALKHAELLKKFLPSLLEYCCANIKKILCHDLAGTVVIELLRVLLSEETMAANAEKLMRCIVDASLVDTSAREISPTPPEPQAPTKPKAVVEMNNVVGDSVKMVHGKQSLSKAEPAPGTSLNNIDVSTMDAATAKNIVKLQQFQAMKQSDAQFMQLNAKYEVELINYQLLERRHRPQIKNEDEKHGMMEHGLGHRRLRKMVEEFDAIHPYFVRVLLDESIVTPQQWMYFLSAKGVYVVWELWNCGNEETKKALKNTLMPIWMEINDEMMQKLKDNELNYDGLKKLCNALDIDIDA